MMLMFIVGALAVQASSPTASDLVKPGRKVLVQTKRSPRIIMDQGDQGMAHDRGKNLMRLDPSMVGGLGKNFDAIDPGMVENPFLQRTSLQKVTPSHLAVPRKVESQK